VPHVHLTGMTGRATRTLFVGDHARSAKGLVSNGFYKYSLLILQFILYYKAVVLPMTDFRFICVHQRQDPIVRNMPFEDIAVVGMSFRMPQSANDELTLYEVLRDRRNLMTAWPESRTKLNSFYDAKSNVNRVRNLCIPACSMSNILNANV
jgi:hypothetical protein